MAQDPVPQPPIYAQGYGNLVPPPYPMQTAPNHSPQSPLYVQDINNAIPRTLSMQNVQGPMYQLPVDHATANNLAIQPHLGPNVPAHIVSPQNQNRSRGRMAAIHNRMMAERAIPQQNPNLNFQRNYTGWKIIE